MPQKKKSLPPKFQVWVDARNRFRLSHAQIQMARELGLNPGKLGSLANHDQERWKSPLPTFIEELYFERFGRERPDVVRTIEEMLQVKQAKRQNQGPTKKPLIGGIKDDDEIDIPF